MDVTTLLESISMVNGPRVTIEEDTTGGLVVKCRIDYSELAISASSLPDAYVKFNNFQREWMAGKLTV